MHFLVFFLNLLFYLCAEALPQEAFRAALSSASRRWDDGVVGAKTATAGQWMWICMVMHVYIYMQICMTYIYMHYIYAYIYMYLEVVLL